MLRQPFVQEQPAVRVSPEADRYFAQETAARYNGLVLRKNEVSHRRGQFAELRAPGDVQREVCVAMTDAILLVRRILLNIIIHVSRSLLTC